MKIFSKETKKGQMSMSGPMNQGVMTVFGLFFIGILVLSFALAGGEMKDSEGASSCSGYWNTTSQQCEVSNTNSTLLTTNTEAYGAINDTIEGVSSFANFSPTLWIMTAIG